MTDTNHPKDAPLLETQTALVANWDVVPVGEAEDDLNWQLLVEALAERIGWLLRHNLDKLMSALYRLDVPERRYREAMGLASTEAKAVALAEAILDRETEKIAMRRKYARQQGGYMSDAFVEGAAPDVLPPGSTPDTPE